jgi:hypothetical protein
VARIGDNAWFWASFLCSSMAQFICIAALTGFAFHVGNDEIDDRLAGQWLVFLLILLVASFSIGNPTNALAVMGVVLMSVHWLLPASQYPGEATPGVRRRYRLELREVSFRFVVSGVAAVIFLIQFAVASTTGDFCQRFPLLDLANVPQTFALGGRDTIADELDSNSVLGGHA